MSYPPAGQRATWPFFGRQKRHLSAYYGIKFQLKMTVKIMNMMMKIVIILMFDDDNCVDHVVVILRNFCDPSAQD